MLLTLVGALLAVPAGLIIDVFGAKLALEWYASPDEEESDEAGAGEPESVSGVADDEPLQPPWALREGAGYRTAIVVALTMLLFGAVWHFYGGRPWQAAIASAYAAVLIICTETDLLARRIANAVTYPAILGAFAVGMLAPGADRIDVLLGAVLGGGVLLAFALLPGNGIGDAKLGLFMGLALGGRLTFPALLIMALAGGLVACAILIGSRLRARQSAIPYGPYIAIGMIVVMLLEGSAFHRF
ncbi:MAG: A24 family peptidase [Chloroflexota bacterium]|nr:A24 family peptidase [Chloroflexota bacterium]